MKRTNVIIDEALVEEACRVTGERTWSAVIDYALREVIRRHKARQILTLQGTDFWEGDLGEMRGDEPWRPMKKPSEPKPFDQLKPVDKIDFDSRPRGMRIADRPDPEERPATPEPPKRRSRKRGSR